MASLQSAPKGPGDTGSSSSSSSAASSRAAQDVEAQLSQIREDIASLAKTVASFGSSKADDYKAKIGDMTSEAVQASQAALSNVKSEFDHLEQSIKDHIRAKPLQSVGIAAAVAFLVAMTQRR